EQRQGHLKPKGLGGFEIDHELKPRRLLRGQITGPCALTDEKIVNPVVFPLGRERLVTRPAQRMSSANATIGIVDVTSCATFGAKSPDARITSTFPLAFFCRWVAADRE